MRYYYFSTEWCGPCKAIKPLVMASGRPVSFIDADANKELATKFNVRSVPTVVGVNGDAVTERYTGAASIQSWLNTKN